MNNTTLPSDDYFEVLQQKLKNLRLLLQKIERGIQEGEPIKKISGNIKKAQKLRDECESLKHDIKYQINKNIH